MTRLFIIAFLFVLVPSAVFAQNESAFQLHPYRIFTNDDLVRRAPTTFTLDYFYALDANTIYAPKVTACSYKLFIGDGDSVKVVQSGVGKPSVVRNQYLLNVDLFDLQPTPIPRLAITLRMQPICCREPYDTTIVYPLYISIEPPFYVGEVVHGSNTIEVLSKTLRKKQIGIAQQGIYGIGGLPAKATSATITVRDDDGQVVREKKFTGTPYITSQPRDTLAVKYWAGGYSVSAQVNSNELPYGGLTTTRAIPDEYPEIVVEATEGFGPFDHTINKVNKFRVANLGRTCTSLIWSITYTAPNGMVRTVFADTIPYYYPLDYAEFEYNMRDVTINSTLNVQAIFSTVPPSPVVSIPIVMERVVPRLRFENVTPPVRPVTPVAFNVVLHNLPPRMIEGTMVLTTVSGVVLKEVRVTAPGNGAYINEIKIPLNSGDLPEETYVIRARGTNEQRDDMPDYVRPFIIRDTSKPFLIADSWGFYTQGDSATIRMGAQNLPAKLSQTLRITFSIVDSANKAAGALYKSEPILVTNLPNRDSIIYMPGNGYPTVDLPLSAQAEMLVEIQKGQSWEPLYNGKHPVLMLRSPGKFTSTPSVDSIHVVTRNSPITLKLEDIDPDVKNVRFMIRGTVTKTPVLQELVPVDAATRSATVTMNAGLLPVNAVLNVQTVTSLSDDVGGQLRRLVNTKPDTLVMTSEPPISDLVMSWHLDNRNEIQRTEVLNSRLTFSRIPAQTEQIIIRSYDDTGNPVDSLVSNVPYRVRYDSNLQVSVMFPFRRLNTARLEVRYISAGGPEGGIEYNSKVSARLSEPPAITVIRTATINGRIELRDEPAIYQSDDVLSLLYGWVLFKKRSKTTPNGYNDDIITLDSIRVQLLDCAGNVLYTERMIPYRYTSNSQIAELHRPVKDLPLAFASTKIVMYSKSLGLPKDGLVTTAASPLLPNPRLHIPNGDSYTTHLIADTVTLASVAKQSITFRNADGVESIDSLVITDKNNSVVHRFASQKPIGDSIQTEAYDFAALVPEGSPYSIKGLVRVRTCALRTTLSRNFATFNVSRLMPDPRTENWVYSSNGWGPFEQGGGQQTVITTSVNPKNTVGLRGDVADSVTIEICGYSDKLDTTITTPRIYGYRITAKEPLPNTLRASGAVSVNGFDEASFIRVRVRHTALDLNGLRDGKATDYLFPMKIIPLADQPIDKDTTQHEQSVLAGSTSTKVMESNYPFRMMASTSGIEQLELTMLSTDGVTLDSFVVPHTMRDTMLKRSEFTSLRDVAQYAWPHIARDRTAVTVRVGFKFYGATVPTKYQEETINILPRAEWLNGLTVRLDGTPSATGVPLVAELLLPSEVFKADLPIFGAVSYLVGSTVPVDQSTKHTFRASYNPTTRQFRLFGNAPGDNYGNPNVGMFGGINSYKSAISDDGKTSDDFTALYRFEPGALSKGDSVVINNRELRMRGLYSSGTTGILPMLSFINNLKEVITRVAKTAGSIATLGLGSITPTFTLGSSAGQLSTVNVGVDEKGSLMHRGASDPTFTTKPNDFPTSQAVSASVSGGGGVDIEVLFGIAGMSCTVTDELKFASGTTFSGSVSNRIPKKYPTRVTHAKWLNLEANFLWGLFSINLFQGRLSHIYSNDLMPSYIVFDESWSSVFKSAQKLKGGDATQEIKQIAKLADETPFYRPAPMLSANDSGLVSVHLEQSLLGNSGRIVLSTLDTTTHSLRKTAVIVESSQGIHTPAVALAGNSGSAFVAWQQNESDPDVAAASENFVDLLLNENMRIAYYDANNGNVTILEEPADSTQNLVDGRPRIAVAPDGNHAVVVWPAMHASGEIVDVYFRTITREDGVWKLGPPKCIFETAGNDYDARIVAMNDGSFLSTWISRDPVQRQIRAFASQITVDGVATVSPIASIQDKSTFSITDIELAGNGEDAVMLVARAQEDSTLPCVRTISMYHFSKGAWSPRTELNALSGTGVCREVEASMRADGSIFIVADNVDHKDTGKAERIVVTLAGNVNVSQDKWNVYRNSEVVHDNGRAIWDMTTAIGPRNIRYVAMQELDSTRNNRQTYKNGLQLGQTYCNAVVRAMRVDGSGNLVPVQFGNTPTSVDDDPNAELEMALRYRIKVMDPAPNPVHEACVVPIAVQIPTTIDVKLIDAVGSYVATLYAGPVQQGIQGISFLVSDLPAGHYSVVVSDNVGPVGSVPVVVVR